MGSIVAAFGRCQKVMHVDGEYGGGGDDVSRVGVGGDYMMFVAMA